MVRKSSVSDELADVADCRLASPLPPWRSLNRKKDNVESWSQTLKIMIVKNMYVYEGRYVGLDRTQRWLVLHSLF